MTGSSMGLHGTPVLLARIITGNMGGMKEETPISFEESLRFL
jgi:hypothetical protein